MTVWGNTLGWTYNNIDNIDTYIGANSYEAQEYGVNDCATNNGGNSYRCNFAYTSVQVGCPGSLNAVHSCDTSVYPATNKSVFSWTSGSDSGEDVLRIDYDDGIWMTNSDWFVSSTASSVSCSTSGSTTSCTANIPGSINKAYLEGTYNEWSVTSYYPDFISWDQANKCSTVETSNYTLSSCNPYIVVGTIHNVDVDESAGTCTLNSDNPLLGSVADISDLELIFECKNPVDCTLESNVAGNSTYTLPSTGGLSGVAGTLAPSDYKLDSILGNLPGVEYVLTCSDTGSGYEDNVGPGTPLSIDATDFDPANTTSTISLGYELSNSNPQGWFTAIDGDVFGNDIASEISTVTEYVDQYLTSHLDLLDVTAFGNTIDVGGDALISEPREGLTEGRYVKGFTGSFWPPSFSYTAPDEVVDNNTVSDWHDIQGSLNTGQAYFVQANILNTFLKQSSTYTLQGPKGVTVLFVGPPGNSGQTLEFEESITSTNDSRILIITDADVEIFDTVGIDPDALPLDSSGSYDTHIEMSIISSSDITVLGNNDPDVPDKVLVMEGPLVAGNNDPDDTASISVQRNLGLFNGAFPSLIVNYNPIYLIEVGPESNIMEVDIIWNVE